MSENEEENFEIMQCDLRNEFNINRRKRQTKEQKIYGIWADDSDDEDGSYKWSGFVNSKRQRTPAAPISFVAGGVNQAGKKKVMDRNDQAKEILDDKHPENYEDKPGTSRRFADSSSEESDGSIAESGRKRFGHKSDTIDTGADIAGLRKRGMPVNSFLMQTGVGNWEKHTKGIGAKLLLQMGYQPGKGLGKELQGISAPVEAYLRKGRGAIGAYGPEKVSKMEDLHSELEEETIDKMSEKGELSQWRKVDSKKSKVKYVYKSVDDVLEEEGRGKQYKREFNELSKVKVIDMTGPQQRILSGYHAISGPQRPADEWELRKEKKFCNFACPELQHNINLLVDVCEQDVIANDRKLRHARDRVVALEQERITLNQKVAQEERQIVALDSVLVIVQKLEPSTVDKLSLEEIAQEFKKLQDEHYEEYKLYNLDHLAPIVLIPILQVQMKKWSPFEDPTHFMSVFKQWRDILEVEHSALGMKSSMTVEGSYHRLVWETWMPVVRSCISTWKCRDNFEHALRFLDLWASLIPSWIFDNILEQNILPRIREEIEKWDPSTDKVQVHTWIFPWLPRLGKHFETTVLPAIQHKLSSALVSWHAGDSSALTILELWSNAFRKEDMNAFLVKNILPKLQTAMSQIIINPHHQELDEWNSVMSWQSLLPTRSLVSLLDKLFFPKWHQVLKLWISSNLPDYNQIANWYSGWKLMFSETLLQQPIIRDHFRQALELMNEAVSNSEKSTERNRSFPEQGASASRAQHRFTEIMAEATKPASQIPQSFKDLVQKRCEESGIVFVPLVNRKQNGNQVYQMGNLQVYIHRGVVFLNTGTNSVVWKPTNLEVALKLSI